MFVAQPSCRDTTPKMSTTMATVTEAVELQTFSKANIPDPSIRNTRLSLDAARTLGGSQNNGVSESESSSLSAKKTSNLQTFLTIFTPSFVGFIASFTNGVITKGLSSKFLDNVWVHVVLCGYCCCGPEEGWKGGIEEGLGDSNPTLPEVIDVMSHLQLR